MSYLNVIFIHKYCHEVGDALRTERPDEVDGCLFLSQGEIESPGIKHLLCMVMEDCDFEAACTLFPLRRGSERLLPILRERLHT